MEIKSMFAEPIHIQQINIFKKNKKNRLKNKKNNLFKDNNKKNRFENKKNNWFKNNNKKKGFKNNKEKRLVQVTLCLSKKTR